MKFCIMKDIITPDMPVFQSGFAARTHKSVGVHDDPYVKAILLQANKPVLVIALDLCSGDRSFIDGIKAALGEKFGFRQDEILINFSHTHHTISVTGDNAEKRERSYSIMQDTNMPENIDGITFTEDIRYFRFLRDKILDLTGKCFENLEDGEMHLGLGTSKAGVSRRLITPQGLKWAPNYNQKIDEDLFVIKLVGTSGETRGIIFSYGCHPTSMNSDNYMLSTDFVGYACKYLEGKYKESCAVFLQACGGDIKPVKCADGEAFKSCSFEEMKEAGADLGRDAAAVMDRGEFRKINAHFRTCLRDTKLYTGVAHISELEKVLQNPNAIEARKRKVREIIESIRSASVKQYIPFYISVWQLDEDTRIVGLEGEAVNDLGRKIKNLYSNDKTIVLGYSNGVQCYIPTREVLAEGGYERDSFMYMGLCGPFIPEIEDIIFSQVLTADCR